MGLAAGQVARQLGRLSACYPGPVNERLVWGAIAASLLAGGLGGYLLARLGDADESADADAGSRASVGRTGAPASGPSARGSAHRASTAADHGEGALLNRPAPNHEPADGDDFEADEQAHGSGGAGGDELGAAGDAKTVAELRAEVSALRQERLELMGAPIPAPSRSPERFGGDSLSSAVNSALADEGVGGEVEATDCSEHPCILFGRLEGDEEDMEEVERSPALEAYQDDVLTLLFWATSVEDEANANMPETGLFALAFYSVDERRERGEQLDQRIRARVMEYWNTDRPGQPN